MRAFIMASPGLSRAMNRIVEALAAHSKDIEFVFKEEDADLVILHVVGYPETFQAVERIQNRGQRYGMLQYCLRTTQEPSTRPWVPLWYGAEFVWSYYDLPSLIEEDELCHLDFNFLTSPLGVDPSVFNVSTNRLMPRTQYTCATSGYLAGPESVGEVNAAIGRVRGTQFHLGPRLRLPYPDVHFRLDIPDAVLARYYEMSQFVSGLRRVEGFELPAAEGLLCGARPILYDRPHYRKWYRKWGYFIEEGSSENIVGQLEDIFKTGPEPVTNEELEEAKEMFSWKRFADQIWSSVGVMS